MADNWGVYTNDWGVSTDVNMDDINHISSLEHRDKHGMIRKIVTGKLNIEDNLEEFTFDYIK